MACNKPYFVGHIARDCGRCLPCRIADAQRIRDRIELELEHNATVLNRRASFVTLTFDPEHLDHEDDDGNYHELGVVKRDHVRRFIDTLRKRIERARRDGCPNALLFRYACTAEYGKTSTLRPHYHLVITLGPNDMIGGMTFREHVQVAWAKGNAHTLPLIKGAAGYLANYTVKNRRKAGHPDLLGRPGEFFTASNGGGRRKDGSKSPGGLGAPMIDYHFDQVKAGPYASAIDGSSTPDTIKTGFRAIRLRKYTLRRFRKNIAQHYGFDCDEAGSIAGYGVDAAGNKYELGKAEVVTKRKAWDWLTQSIGEVEERSIIEVRTKTTYLQRVNYAAQVQRSARIAAARLGLITQGHGARDDGLDPDILVNAEQAFEHLYRPALDRLIANHARIEAQSTRVL